MASRPRSRAFNPTTRGLGAVIPVASPPVASGGGVPGRLQPGRPARDTRVSPPGFGQEASPPERSHASGARRFSRCARCREVLRRWQRVDQGRGRCRAARTVSGGKDAPFASSDEIRSSASAERDSCSAGQGRRRRPTQDGRRDPTAAWPARRGGSRRPPRALFALALLRLTRPPLLRRFSLI
jgi:hypothetical protein